MEHEGNAPVDGRGKAGPGRLEVPLRITKTGKGALELQWQKHAAGRWCLLGEADLNGMGSRYGVFIIWRNGDAAKVSAVLYVGRGRLSAELAECRRSPLFSAAQLRVTWAEVADPHDLDGVATYLYQQLRPIWGEIMSSALPVPVNLPMTA
jgi:hypothetical protein